MTYFEDREKAFEGKFKMDEEMRFKLNARSVRNFGLWAAKELGLSGADAEAYAQQVIDADFDEPGIADVLRKVKADLDAKGIAHSEHHLENEFNRIRDEAAQALLAS